jgi:hypothetical protein
MSLVLLVAPFFDAVDRFEPLLVLAIGTPMLDTAIGYYHQLTAHEYEPNEEFKNNTFVFLTAHELMTL